MKIANLDRTTDPPRPSGPRRRGRTLPAASLIGAALVAALVAGCGGSTGGGVAHIGSSTSANASPTSAGKSGLAYSQCMRSHGEPNFPDPHGSGPQALPQGINPGSPAFQTAVQDCKSLAPVSAPTAAQNSQLQALALKLADCMRSHGVPNYPDPKVSGGVMSEHLGSSSGVNSNSPAFQRAQQACRQYLPGASSSPTAGG
jgi:hypothetical protein